VFFCVKKKLGNIFGGPEIVKNEEITGKKNKGK